MQLFEYLGNPLRFQSQALTLPKNSYRHLLRSQMASFGYHGQVFQKNLDKNTVKNWIKWIDEDFDLILIMEYFDYSLALLSIGTGFCRTTKLTRQIFRSSIDFMTAYIEA